MMSRNTGALISRLCRRGEAWCGTVVDYENRKLVCCGEPAAVAYRAYSGMRWSYACAEHWGYEETQKLREAAKKEE